MNAELVGATFILVAMHLFFGEADRNHARARIRLRKLLRERDDLGPLFAFLIKLTTSGIANHKLARLVAEGVRSSDPETRMAALSARSNMRENIGDLRGALLDGRLCSTTPPASVTSGVWRWRPNMSGRFTANPPAMARPSSSTRSRRRRWNASVRVTRRCSSSAFKPEQ
ncbi:hypothetical protein ACETU7_33375 [Rhodococcus sp. 3Y1]